MKHILFLGLVSCNLLAGSVGKAQAQYPYSPYAGPGPYNRPPVLSPYLDLVRSRNTPAINYFLGTRPEFQRRQDALELRALERDFAASQLTPGLAPDEEGVQRLQPTGHATYFMNLSPYFYPGAAQGGLYRPGMTQQRQTSNTPNRPATGRQR
jgi:hypothetical protein